MLSFGPPVPKGGQWTLPIAESSPFLTSVWRFPCGIACSPVDFLDRTASERNNAVSVRAASGGCDDCPAIAGLRASHDRMSRWSCSDAGSFGVAVLRWPRDEEWLGAGVGVCSEMRVRRGPLTPALSLFRGERGWRCARVERGDVRVEKRCGGLACVSGWDVDLRF